MALALVLVALSFWGICENWRYASLILAVPLVIAVAQLSGILTPGYNVLAPGPGSAVSRPDGRIVGALRVLGLTLALLFVRHRSRWSINLSYLLAAAGLCLGALSVTLFILLNLGQMNLVRGLASPMPAGIGTMVVAMAFLIWRQDRRWALLFPTSTRMRLIIIISVPLALVIPALPILPLLMQDIANGHVGATVFALVGNMVIVGAFAWILFDRLATQQERFQQLSFALDVAAVAITKRDGTILTWSRGCEQMFGWSRKEAIGRNRVELLRSSSALPDFTTTDPATGYIERESLDQRRDGSQINILERTQQISRPGRLPLLVIMMLDISEKVRVELALRDSEALLAAAADAQRVGISHLDVTTGQMEWSPGSEQRLGLPVGGISTLDKWLACVDPRDASEVVNTMRAAVAQRREIMEYRFRLVEEDGHSRVIEGSGRCTYDADGRLVNVIGASIDVTGRVEREEALKAREAQLNSILEAAPSALVVVNADRRIVAFSAAAEKLWKYKAADMIGTPVGDLIPADQRAWIDALLSAQMNEAMPATVQRSIPATVVDRDNKILKVEISAGRANLPTGTLVNLFFRDLSDQLTAQQRLGELSADLAHLGRQSAMSELAADLAHELNQPLSATINFLASARMLIAQGGEPSQVSSMLRLGEEQTLRSGEIIRRLRNFLSRREIDMRPESLEQTVREAVELVLFGKRQFDIRLQYDFDPEADLVFVDRIQVQQVIVNLLRNAMDALKDTPAALRQISISSRPLPNRFVEVVLTDNGPGLPPELIGQLYDRFATTKEGSAMGIGLSISRRIVEAHGGTILAETSDGGGATFRITLPALEEVDE